MDVREPRFPDRLLALPLYWGLANDGPRARVVHLVAVFVLMLCVAASVRIAMHGYYQIDRDGTRVGEFVRARTTDRDLVIMAFNDAYFLDPRYLYYAQRRGWSIRGDWLEPRAIEGLRPHGATVVVTSDLVPAPEPTEGYLKRLPLVDTLSLGEHHVYLRRIE